MGAPCAVCGDFKLFRMTGLTGMLKATVDGLFTSVEGQGIDVPGLYICHDCEGDVYVRNDDDDPQPGGLDSVELIDTGSPELEPVYPSEDPIYDEPDVELTNGKRPE